MKPKQIYFRTTVIASICFHLTFPPFILADWRSDAISGAMFWVPDSSGGSTGRWNGPTDNEGYATGDGMLSFFRNGKLTSQYTGTMSSGKIDGYVKATYLTDGPRLSYEGEIVNFQEHGQGTLRFKSGAVYTGSFKYEQMDGFGDYRHAGGTRYIGQFVNGNMEGVGTFYNLDGSFYNGEFSNDEQHGEGVLTRADGQRIRMISAYGKPISKTLENHSESVEWDTASTEPVDDESDYYQSSATHTTHNTYSSQSASSNGEGLALLMIGGSVVLGLGTLVFSDSSEAAESSEPSPFGKLMRNLLAETGKQILTKKLVAIGQNNPLLAGALQEALDSLIRKRGFSIENVGQNTLTNYLMDELRENGHANIATTAEVASFAAGLFEE